ncbi:MAG: DUF4267 domain-containing protein [Candidatus Dormibacteraeota bacterium]|uniref:DUF4267 domain-containing protein n=1 Tax=Candidatus Amunia macphersoniae TaxID=3127014 RepID=A0A934NG10_9BACT|nr:DUF4267 domain-containing protein [Candidatus Dormibacteraeota bacterium]
MAKWRRGATRLIGAGTAAYGLSLLVRPSSLAKQCGLDNPDDPSTRLLAITFGARDLVSGISILRVHDRSSLRLALTLRGLFDLGDAAACAALLTDSGARMRVCGVAGLWGALSLTLAATS